MSPTLLAIAHPAAADFALSSAIFINNYYRNYRRLVKLIIRSVAVRTIRLILVF